jgi:superfamily II DNA or RNA helicase
MRTQLYNHNKTAYQKVMRAFETADRTCVVHPTGTGKSYLIAAVSESFKRVLILGPNTFVLDQVHSVLKWRKRGVEYMTYQTLNLTENPHTDYDLICIDEFHRTGAPEWGAAVDRLLELNAAAKVFGTTATHIRYLDNERNMADELFHGNIASYITIAEAWNQSILPIPRYVSGLFRWDKTVSEAQERIERSRSLSDKEKRERIFRLTNAHLHWELSYGMPAILKKHLDKDARRVIVFCGNIESLEQMCEEVVGWFREAGFTVASTCIMHSDLTDREQREQMDRFEDDTDGKGVKLMFSVNMLNEGVHVPNVNAVLMLRTTSSRIIYMQQMGRCLTAANTQKPLVLDMVDNITTTTAIKGLLDEFEILERETADSESREPRKFEVKDYTLGVRDLIEKLVPEPERMSFEERLAMATAFCEKHGRMPGKRDDKKEMKNWALLTVHYRDRQEVQDLIAQFGRVVPTFDERLARATAFCEKHGHTPGTNDDKEEARSWWYLLVGHGKRPEVQALRNQYGRPMGKPYEARLEQVMAFCTQHGRLPKSRVKEEKEEYDNWGALLGAHRKKPEVQALIEKYGRVVVSYEERLRQATAFCERHNRLPNPKTEKEEYNNWKNLWISYKDRQEVQVLRDRYEEKQMTFEERIAMATAFCRKHGRVPGKADRNEKNNWHYLLVHYGDSREVLKLREDYGKIDAILSYEERLSQATAFCKKHGRSPKAKDDKADYDNWRMLLGSYRDRQEVIALREQYGNRVALSFEDRLAQATAFCEANNRFPLLQDGKREWYNWKILVKSYGDRQQVQDLRGRYKRLMTFEERLAQATAFCKKHGRAPKVREEEEYNNWERLLMAYGDRQEVLELRRKYGKKKI